MFRSLRIAEMVSQLLIRALVAVARRALPCRAAYCTLFSLMVWVNAFVNLDSSSVVTITTGGFPDGLRSTCGPELPLDRVNSHIKVMKARPASAMAFNRFLRKDGTEKLIAARGW